ncbi:DUF4041 domain-containing protein [Convivina intestini]|uniref:DUF4041 domain-containing protein n=2 Tax=Convivina TaxID=1697027 RepID=UPI002010C5F9|nr:DUF4041 domain-containing protein [Convivina intestini]CAH1853903.1 hypothetical protein R078131_00862 [Convivina intestini]CAH1856023.1 hypothetical protein R078138_01243 [Convivina sp. LMG 32447]
MKLFKRKDEKLEEKIITLNNSIDEKNNELNIIRKKIVLANQDLENINNEIEMGFYEPTYQLTDSLTLKEKLKGIIESEKLLVRNKQAFIITQSYTFNQSIAKGKTMQNKSGSALIRAFNGEATGIINKVTANNYENKLESLTKSYEKLNSLFDSFSFVVISNEYLKLKIEELTLSVEYALKKQEEKDILKEQREREIEEKKLQKEVEIQHKIIEKERKQYQNALSKLEKQEKNDEILEQIASLKLELQRLDDDAKELDYRISNSKAGYVYIISNIGSFGQNVYKIGVTRRLTPMDRIDELGSASVPFKFDVHALIFSENAFQLERELHKEFTNSRVNHINNRKEYFNVSLDEIKKFIKEQKNITIEWHDHPENSEFELSQKSNQRTNR